MKTDYEPMRHIKNLCERLRNHTTSGGTMQRIVKYCELIETHAKVSDQTVANNLPWKKMRVDVAHCVGCGVCVNVCPTGALVKEVHDLELTRTLNYSLCNNCGVCAEACPQDVIRFEQTYSLADIVKDIDEEVAKVSLNACVICGEIIPVSEGEVCTTCQKRQVVPMFR